MSGHSKWANIKHKKEAADKVEHWLKEENVKCQRDFDG